MYISMVLSLAKVLTRVTPAERPAWHTGPPKAIKALRRMLREL